MSYCGEVENSGLPAGFSAATEMTNARIDGFYEAIGRNNDRVNRRHAELAALVAEMTVALEALERKVETIVRLNLEDAGLIPKEVDADPDPRLLNLRSEVSAKGYR